MSRQRLRLILKMATHRPAGAFSTVTLTLLLVVACISVSASVSAYERTVERSAHSNFGAYSHQVTGNDDVASYMQELERQGLAAQISHSRQNILATTAAKRATSADVTLVSGPADLGVLVDGRYPQKAGELSVSREVAGQLQIHAGDRVDLVDVENTGTRASFTMVGITENPASINEISAIGITADSQAFVSSGVWLTNDELAEVQTILSRGGGEVADVSSVVKRATAQAMSYHAVSPQMARLFGGFMIVTLVTVIYAADRRRRRNVYRVLIVLGDKPVRAALTTSAQTTLLALSGWLLGSLLAVTLFPSASGHLATYLEQRWDQIQWISVVIAALAVLAVLIVGGAFTAAFTVASQKFPQRQYSDGFSQRLLMGGGIAGTIVTLLLVISRQLYLFPQGHRVAMIVGAISVPAVAYAIGSATRKRTVTARLSNRLQKLSLTSLAIIFALNYYGSLYASGVADLTNWLSRQIRGETSYLQINDATEQSVDNLLKRFPEIKSRIAIFGDISTREQMFRITDAQGTPCFTSAQTVNDCPQTNLDMVYVASGGFVDQTYVGHAPASYVTTDKKVTLLGIGIGDSRITRVFTIDDITGDSNLDNNVLRGLILPADSPLLKELGVTKPQSYTAIITGFAELPDHVRDGVRSIILTQAPFAFLNDSDDPEHRQLRAQSIAHQLFTVIVSGALLLALVTTIISDQRIERRLVALTGGGRRTQVRLVKPLLIAYTLSVSSAVILGRLASMDRIPFTHSVVTHHYGIVWTIGLAGLFFLIPAVYMATRSSTNPNENNT